MIILIYNMDTKYKPSKENYLYQNSAILFIVEVGRPQGINTSLTNQVSKDALLPIVLF